MSPSPGTLEETDRDEAEQVAEPAAARWRVLLVAVLGPLVTGYAAVAALLALVTAMAPGASFSTLGVLRAAAPGWLATFQVSPHIGGNELGALPLLPTIAVLLLVAHTAGGAAERLALSSPGQAAGVILAMAAAHGLFGLALTRFSEDGPVSVAPLAALCCPVGLSALAAAVGLVRCPGLLDGLWTRVNPIVLAGLRAGLLGLGVLVTAGAAVVTLGLVTSVPVANELFRRGTPGFGDGVGMLLLSMGYLPNAVVAGTSFVTGTGMSLGAFSVSPTRFEDGPLPGVPLLAALPQAPAGWWPTLLLVPVLAGAFLGWSLRHLMGEPLDRVRCVGVAAIVVGVGCAVLGTFAGGRLAGGPFDPFTVHPWSFGMAALLWTALPGAAVAWLAGPREELDLGGSLLDDDPDEFDTDFPDGSDDPDALDDREDFEDWDEYEEWAEPSAEASSEDVTEDVTEDMAEDEGSAGQGSSGALEDRQGD